MSLPDPAAGLLPGAPSALYLGDSGDLPFETRRVLVQFLVGPSLEARRHSQLWPVLLRDETLVRRRLSDLFLDLVLDRDLQVAFTRQADVGELEVPVLLRRAPLTFIDSVVLLHLRQRLSQADVHAERAVISTQEIMDHLGPYERSANTDHAGFAKRVSASIEKLKTHSILQKIRASEDRFEISPTLKLLFSAEEIQSLTTAYKDMVSGSASQPTTAEPDEDDA